MVAITGTMKVLNYHLCSRLLIQPLYHDLYKAIIQFRFNRVMGYLLILSSCFIYKIDPFVCLPKSFLSKLIWVKTIRVLEKGISELLEGNRTVCWVCVVNFGVFFQDIISLLSYYYKPVH